MTPEQIEARIVELETEIQEISTAFNTEKARVQQVEQAWQEYGTKAQRDVTLREGAVVECRRNLEELKAAQPPAQT
jgi:flagellar biosynthesis chaperone FliJ